MERNGNTGGNNKSSDFEDIMREGGVSDEFTPHRWTYQTAAPVVRCLIVK